MLPPATNGHTSSTATEADWDYGAAPAPLVMAQSGFDATVAVLVGLLGFLVLHLLWERYSGGK